MPFGFVPYPQRMASGGIVSLVPSLTELVFALGAGERLAGRTRFCTEPAGAVEAVPIVGGTKNPRVDRITGLRPSLVLANKEENRREDIEALRRERLKEKLPSVLVQKVATLSQLRGVAGTSSWLFVGEFFAWRTFRNRRQVGQTVDRRVRHLRHRHS